MHGAIAAFVLHVFGEHQRAAAVLGIFDEMKDGERDALAARLGPFGQCAARLIWVNSLQEV